MSDTDLKFLMEECGFTKERALKVLNAFKEMRKVAQNSGYKLNHSARISAVISV